ncbi:hypothetical protein OH77DRAFT_1426192 [Trametes cingulata]|nr:hypothetical protein OH77DRAFT_1426192 [Trametes cingulata]
MTNSRLRRALTGLLWGLWCCLPSSIRVACYRRLWRFGDASYCHRIRMLPFGLVLKRMSGSPYIEAENIRFIAANTSIPVPRILDAVDFVETNIGHSSPEGLILMTRIEGQRLDEWISNHAIRPPGEQELLDQLDYYLSIDDTKGIAATLEKLQPMPMPILNMSDADAALVQDLRDVFTELRSLPPPSPAVTGLSGRPLKCNRAGEAKLIGPFKDQQEFKDFLFAQASTTRMNMLRRLAKPVNAKQHRICFTHADIAARNILVKDGRLAGILDWEFAGWYPEYWEYTSMDAQLGLEHLSRQFWDVVQPFGPGEPYREELALERALCRCTGSFVVPYRDDEPEDPEDLLEDDH